MYSHSVFKMLVLEERTLLSASSGLDHDHIETEAVSKDKKSHSKFSAFGHALKKAAGAVGDFVDKDKKSGEHVSKNFNPDAQNPNLDLEGTKFKQVTDQFLTTFATDNSGDLAILDKIQNTGIAKIAEEAASSIGHLKTLLTSGETKVLDVINHFVAHESHFDSLVTAVKEGIGSLKNTSPLHLDILKKLEDYLAKEGTLAQKGKDFVGLLLNFVNNSEQLHGLINAAESGVESLKGGVVNFATAISGMLGNVDGVLDMIKEIKKHPEALQDPQVQGMVASMSDSMAHVEHLLTEYAGMSKEEQLALIKDAESLGVEVEAYIKKAKPDAFNNQVVEDKVAVEESTNDTQAPVKKKTKNPFVRTLHYTQKYIAKPAIQEIKNIEESIKNKILEGAHSIENKAKKLKNHLKSFASSDEKLKFIFKDIKNVGKSIAHKAKSVFDAVNPTKENRSKWEHELAHLTRKTADVAVKIAHFIEDHTTYTPMVAKVGQYLQMIVLATSKTILLGAGIAGMAATAYPPCVAISLALVIASRGLDLAGDLIPLGLKAVDDLGHLHMRFVNFMQGRAYNVADLMDKQADHLHAQAVEASKIQEPSFMEGVQLALQEHNVIGFVAGEVHEEIQETITEVGELKNAIQYARQDIQEDLQQAVQHIDKKAVMEEVSDLNTVIAEAFHEGVEALSGVKSAVDQSGVHLNMKKIDAIEGGLEKAENVIPVIFAHLNNTAIFNETLEVIPA